MKPPSQGRIEICSRLNTGRGQLQVVDHRRRGNEQRQVGRQAVADQLPQRCLRAAITGAPEKTAVEAPLALGVRGRSQAEQRTVTLRRSGGHKTKHANDAKQVFHSPLQTRIYARQYTPELLVSREAE